MTSPPKLTIAPKHLMILLLPVLVLTASELMLSVFANTHVTHADIQIVENPQLAELTGRYRFLSVFFFYAAIGVTLLAIFGAELFTRHTVRSIVMTLVAVTLAIAVSLVFSMVEPEWMGSFEAYELLGEDLFAAALGAGQLPFCRGVECENRGAFFAMTYLLDKTNLISSFAVAAVIAGMVLALARSGPVDLSSEEGLIAEGTALQEAQAATRRYLYCSGVLLTIGMMMGLAWMNWPAPLIADPAFRADYKGLVDSVSLFRGVCYTVLILSYYMPVSLILMVRIERFHAAADAADMQDIAQEVKGFDIDRIGSMDAFKAILSITSPILASAVGSFVSLNGFG